MDTGKCWILMMDAGATLAKLIYQIGINREKSQGIISFYSLFFPTLYLIWIFPTIISHPYFVRFLIWQNYKSILIHKWRKQFFSNHSSPYSTFFYLKIFTVISFPLFFVYEITQEKKNIAYLRCIPELLYIIFFSYIFDFLEYFFTTHVLLYFLSLKKKKNGDLAYRKRR